MTQKQKVLHRMVCGITAILPQRRRKSRVERKLSRRSGLRMLYDAPQTHHEKAPGTPRLTPSDGEIPSIADLLPKLIALRGIGRIRGDRQLSDAWKAVCPRKSPPDRARLRFETGC